MTGAIVGKGYRLFAIAIAVAALALAAPPAFADFPFTDGNPKDYTDLYDATTVPNDICGDGNQFKFAASPDPANFLVNADPVELGGVRGAHIFDGTPPTSCGTPPAAVSPLPTAFKLTTGRPDVAIAVLDSGIKWNDLNAMLDLRKKVRLNRGELPTPEVAGPAREPGIDCSGYTASYDANGDGVFNVMDYACDPRVSASPANGVGPSYPSDYPVAPLQNAPLLDPQDAIIAFSDGTDADFNGYVDDIAGWDFLDNDNGPFDDVQYGHGTGEAEDSSSEANNRVFLDRPDPQSDLDVGKQLGACPNCMVLPLRVGDSFIADVNRFAAAVLYATDNGIDVVQEALGTLNNSRFAREAVDYAYRHGVTVIASAADEAAQHNNWPSSLPHVILVNSVRDEDVAPPGSDAEPSCTPPVPNCTDPNGALQTQVNANRQPPGFPASRSYPARKGPDQFYGWGRVNMQNAVSAVFDRVGSRASEIPPEAEIASPEWYAQINPSRENLPVDGQVFARGSQYTCEVLVAPGQYPNNARVGASAPGDFAKVGGSGWCDGTSHTEDHSGPLATINVNALKQRFPPGTDFNGPEPQPTAANGNGRPNPAPHSFTVEVFVHSTQNGVAMTGEDRRAAYLHRDQWMLDGFPRTVTQGGPASGDGESSPAFADLDGDNRNELIYASSDGYVHALDRNGKELPGWPVKGDVPGIVSAHMGARAYTSGEVPDDNLGGAIVGSVAAGDTNGDGVPEVYAADMEGKVYGWSPTGQRIFTEESNPAYSGKPLQPFVNVRYVRDDPATAGEHQNEEEFSKTRRTQHGFIASPVLADLDGDGTQELIAAAMDRHVYAWHTADSDAAHPGGASQVSGFPILVVDPSKVQAIDPQTHAVTFKADADSLMQGAIVDTPVLANIAGDSRPEIVVGTNEEYDEPLNAGNLTTASFAPLSGSGVLSPGNSRLYALKPEGDGDGDPNPSNAILSGWPFAAGIVNSELLPIVGEGITGYPVVAPLTCPSGGSGPKIGVLANNGPAYVLNSDGTSCYGNDPTSGKPNALESDFSAATTQYDHPVIPAVGLPAFGNLGA